MKLSVILGSPRLASSSEKLAKAAAQSLVGPDDSVEYFRLNDLHYRGCQGCYACKTKTEFCVIKDDLTRVLSAVTVSDYVILTSPIYIGEISSQLKGFVDRTFSWYKPVYVNAPEPSRLKPGKKLLFIISQGMPDPAGYQRNIEAYLNYFSSHGFKSAHYIAPIGTDDLETTQAKLLTEVVSLAKNL
ncbi:MAG: flavodoxin family protein [Deltaproteobacteria bacterium]|jgi:multimeric flavodoxin WrbA|nr:flavodoxin family protein [Deltaproteobacteria bacterium]